MASPLALTVIRWLPKSSIGLSPHQTSAPAIVLIHKALRLNPALHLVLSGLAPCFYQVAAPEGVALRSSYIYTVLKLHSAL